MWKFYDFFAKMLATEFTSLTCFLIFMKIVDFKKTQKAVNTTNLLVPDSEQEHFGNPFVCKKKET